MPRIVLKPMPESTPVNDGGVVVGTIGDRPLVYVRRTPFAGDEPLEHADIAQDLLQALEDALSPVFGGDWLTPLHVVTGINIRSVQRDRIVKYGLPAGILAFVGRAAALAATTPDPRAVGDIMMGVARLYEARETGATLIGNSTSDRTPVRIEAEQILERAVKVVGDLREHRRNLSSTKSDD